MAAGESYQAAKENVTDAKAEKNTTEDGGVKMMIRENVVDTTGKVYGKVVKPGLTIYEKVKHSKQAYVSYLHSKIFKRTFNLQANDGSSVTVEFAKDNERIKKDGDKSPRRVLGELEATADRLKMIAIINIRDLLKNSEPLTPNNENSHQWLDAEGWRDRISYMMDNDVVYPVILHIPKTRDGRHLLYDISVIKDEGATVDIDATARASLSDGRASTTHNGESKPAVKSVEPSGGRLAQTDLVVNRESAEAMDVELDAKTESVAPAVLKSERTNYSDRDSTYIDAVNRGDMKTAQRMVDEAARSAGYAVKAYHGTDADAFNVFDKGKFGQATGVGILGDGFYFADSKKIAQKYGKNVYTVYLKQINPYAATDRDAYQLRSVSIERQGYDSVVLPTGNGKVYMVLDPNQIKSAEPVTYDDSGNVIPLSERFNEAKTDIRYSDRGYSYAALVNKPDMVVTNVDGNVPTNRADVVYWAKQNAAKVGKVNPKDGSVSVRVDDIGADVLLGTKGLGHGLRRLSTSQTDPTWRITLKAGEIIKNAIKINEVTPSKEEASGAYVLIGTANNKAGDFYIVRFVVNQYSHELASMDVLYAINAKKEDRLRSMRPGFQGPVTDPKISIADLLDIVNQHFPDILPEDVLKHYGYDARPEGDLGQDALYQDRDTESVSNRALLANAFEDLAQNEIERNKIQEYKGKIDFVNAEERKLRDLNEQIKELSFAKGPRDTAKIRQLRDEATKTANRISIYDKKYSNWETLPEPPYIADRGNF